MKQIRPKAGSFLLVAIAIFTGLQARAADDWPEFRSPTGQGISTAKNVPIHWNAGSNVVWKTAIPGEGWSSPVLSIGKIYLTAAVTAAWLRALTPNQATFTGASDWVAAFPLHRSLPMAGYIFRMKKDLATC